MNVALNIEGYRDFETQISLFNMDNSPYVTAGGTYKAQIRDTPNGSIVVDFNMEIDSNIIKISLGDVETGLLSDKLLSYIEKKELFWDLLESRDEFEQTLVRGGVFVSQGVTRK